MKYVNIEKHCRKLEVIILASDIKSILVIVNVCLHVCKRVCEHVRRFATLQIYKVCLADNEHGC